MTNKEKYGEIMYARGYAKAQRKQAMKWAKNFIQMDILTIEQIAQGLGLTVEEVAEVERAMKEEYTPSPKVFLSSRKYTLITHRI